MNVVIGWAVLLLVLSGFFIFCGFRNGQNVKRNLQRFVENPAEIKAVRRDEDGEGYTRLYVDTVSGKTVQVAYHEELKAAEAKLQAVFPMAIA
jgi:hypothetical protein